MLIRQLPGSDNKGFTLIEVLVAALVLAIGILGIASVILTGLKSDKSAYYRSQASAIAYDIADRMRLNSDALNSYIGIDTDNATASIPSCITTDGGCSAAQQFVVDFFEWKGNFHNVSNVAAFSPKLPNGRGQVTIDGSGRYVVTITWSEDDWANNAGTIARQNTTESLSVRFLSL